MLQTAGRSVVEGAKSDFATTLLGLGFDASGPSQGFEVGWDVEPMGAIETVHHVHHFDVPASLITNMGDFFKLFGGNAPQWDELGNDKLRNQLRRKE